MRRYDLHRDERLQLPPLVERDLLPFRSSSEKWLEFYAEHFNTVELNVSFYRLPRKEVFSKLYKRTPKKFVFGRERKPVHHPHQAIEGLQGTAVSFFDHASPLKEKLGAVLWQLPRDLNFRRRDWRNLRPPLHPPRSKLHRHAFEFRDESWFCKEAFGILEDFRFAFCMAHGSGLPPIQKITSDFIYLRFHGGISSMVLIIRIKN